MPSNKQRREAARRKLERELAARQAAAQRRRQTGIITSVVSAVVVVGVVIAIIAITSGNKSKNNAGASGSNATTATTAATTAAAAANPYPCTFTKSGTAAKKNTAPTDLKPARKGTVDLAVKTTQGDMTFQLNRAVAPCAVESFVSLATQKYYDDTSCHRLVNSGIFVLQCGDPAGNGTGGPGYTVNDEYTGKENYAAGVIAMANTGAANSTGGQFFIMWKDSTAGLGKTYTVVGKVTAGLDVVTKVADGGVTGGTNDGAPKLPIKITSMTKKG